MMVRGDPCRRKAMAWRWLPSLVRYSEADAIRHRAVRERISGQISGFTGFQLKKPGQLSR
jgi:hypothetical protein